MNNGHAIEADGLTRTFGKFTAVDNVSLKIAAGSIFGFLGANGAGKSTTIRMLTGILQPSGGTAYVGGHSVIKEPEKVKQSIGYMSQRFSLYEDLTVLENLTLYGGIYGLDNSRLRDRVEWAVDVAEMAGREDTLARELAGGLKQRLALSCALLHEPEIVFLDEPTSGVDPISRRNFWRLIQSISAQGVTVFVTTHYLEEAEYCHRLSFIYNGRIIVEGTPSDLKRNVIGSTVFEVSGADPNRALDILRNEPFINDVSVFGTDMHVIPADESAGRNDLEKFLQNLNIETTSIREIVPSLEDVFIVLIKEQRSHV